jgi:hypothetical protein
VTDRVLLAIAAASGIAIVAQFYWPVALGLLAGMLVLGRRD